MRAFAFLRGINVGNRRPKKDELIAAADGSELDDVSTYQASGNLLFETDLAGAELEPILERRLEENLGYQVTCFVRTLDDLRAILRDLPEPKADEKLEVIFYKDDPGDDVRADLAAGKGPNDTLTQLGRETIWGHVGPMMDSPLAALTPKKGAPVTTVRTAATIQRMVAKFDRHSVRPATVDGTESACPTSTK